MHADHARDAHQYQTPSLGRFSKILRPRYYLFPGTYALNVISNHLYWLYHIISLWLPIGNWNPCKIRDRIRVNTPTTMRHITVKGNAVCKCGTFELSRQLSCCAQGGDWFQNCGPKMEHTWLEGVQACESKFAFNISRLCLALYSNTNTVLWMLVSWAGMRFASLYCGCWYLGHWFAPSVVEAIETPTFCISAH